MNNLDIPPPPNAHIIAVHIHTERCMGLPIVAYCGVRKVPMWSANITHYDCWGTIDDDGNVVSSRYPKNLCRLVWHIK